MVDSTEQYIIRHYRTSAKIKIIILEVMYMYSLTTLRKRAYKAGYRIEKGFQHYMYNDAVCRDCNGDGYTGYNVWDLSNNQLVWESGCYNGNYDHLCTLEDVEEFLKAEYEKAGLTW